MRVNCLLLHVPLFLVLQYFAQATPVTNQGLIDPRWRNQEIEQDPECPVCLEENDSQRVTGFNCTHELCSSCAKRIAKTCPICRAVPPTSDQVYTAFQELYHHYRSSKVCYEHLSRTDSTLREHALQLALADKEYIIALWILETLNVTQRTSKELVVLATYFGYKHGADKSRALRSLQDIETVIDIQTPLMFVLDGESNFTEIYQRYPERLLKAFKLAVISEKWKYAISILDVLNPGFESLNVSEELKDKAALTALDRDICGAIPPLVRSGLSEEAIFQMTKHLKPRHCFNEFSLILSTDWIIARGLWFSLYSFNLVLFHRMIEMLHSRNALLAAKSYLEDLFTLEFDVAVQEMTRFVTDLMEDLLPPLSRPRFPKLTSLLSSIAYRKEEVFLRHIESQMLETFNLLDYLDDQTISLPQTTHIINDKAYEISSLFDFLLDNSDDTKSEAYRYIGDFGTIIAANSDNLSFLSIFLKSYYQGTRDLALITAAHNGFPHLLGLFDAKTSAKAVDFALLVASQMKKDAVIEKLVTKASQEAVDLAFLVASFKGYGNLVALEKHATPRILRLVSSLKSDKTKSKHSSVVPQ